MRLSPLAIVLSFAAPVFAHSPFLPLTGTDECHRCTHLLMAGERRSSGPKWNIHSDLPEVFLQPGVLYSTAPKLPPFKMADGEPVPDAMLVQENHGFTTIDDDFEVFLFHITQPGGGRSPRRLVVHAQNNGAEPITLNPRQVFISDGIIAAVHEIENTLGRRTMAEEWDRPLDTVTIAPGAGAIVAYSKQFGSGVNGPDQSANVNCFGIAAAEVLGDKAANLVVRTIAVPADPDLRQLNALAERLIAVGADSGEQVIDLSSPPSGCQLRRATGVFENFAWHADPLRFDVADLPGGHAIFQMALPATQSASCPAAQQTGPMLLHPPASRPDTVGNYMLDYFVPLEISNKGAEPRRVDLRFGKEDADIGLGWQILTGASAPTEEALLREPVRTEWAGPKQRKDLPDNTRSFVGTEGLSLEPGTTCHVLLRFRILGNSSVPFQFHLVAM